MRQKGCGLLGQTLEFDVMKFKASQSNLQEE